MSDSIFRVNSMLFHHLYCIDFFVGLVHLSFPYTSDVHSTNPIVFLYAVLFRPIIHVMCDGEIWTCYDPHFSSYNNFTWFLELNLGWIITISDNNWSWTTCPVQHTMNDRSEQYNILHLPKFSNFNNARTFHIYYKTHSFIIHLPR